MNIFRLLKPYSRLPIFGLAKRNEVYGTSKPIAQWFICFPLAYWKRIGYQVSNDEIVYGWWIFQIVIAFDEYISHGIGLRLMWGWSLKRAISIRSPENIQDYPELSGK